MMASNLVLDFRHHYVKGERRASEPIAYQWDLGHVAEIYVPETASIFEVHYAFGDEAQSAGYEVDSVAAADDGGYKILAHVPNDLFERSGDLRVYVVATEDGSILTTYEGYIEVRYRIQPDDYVDDDPDNQARRILEEAQEAAATATEKAAEASDDASTATAAASTASQASQNAQSHANAAAASAVTAAGKAAEASESADRAEEAAETATAASGTKIYSIAPSPDTDGLALYYIPPEEE